MEAYMRKVLLKTNLLSICLVTLFCVLMLSCFVIPQTFAKSADATTGANITIQNKTVHNGQTFDLDIELSNNTGLVSLYLTLDYDSSIMKLINVKKKGALSSLTMTTTNTDTDLGYGILPFNMLWDGREQDNTNGVIATLTFETDIEASVGDYDITLTYNPSSTNSAYNTPATLNINNCIVSIVNGEYTAIYQDYDGTELYSHLYQWNEQPSYVGQLPSRQEDREYSYTFNGWKGKSTTLVDTIVYEADYILTPKVYSVQYFIDGINGAPSGTIEEATDFYREVEYDFGELMDNSTVPVKKFYKFNGWFLDKEFTTSFDDVTMPSQDLSLYGFYSLDVRENNVPEITMSYTKQNNQVEVMASFTKNTGFNGLILTLHYDRSSFHFDNFENLIPANQMGFDTTNISQMDQDNFKFFYESTSNYYQMGNFLKLTFTVLDTITDGVYEIGFSYEEHKDATYLNTYNDIKYTAINIIPAKVPVGTVQEWTKQVTEGISINVTTDVAMSIDTELKVVLVSDEIYIPQDEIEQVVGNKMYQMSAYSIEMIRANAVVQPDGTLTIRIVLTKEEKRSKTLKLYYYKDNGELQEHVFEIIDGRLVFTTNHLSNWVIFGDYEEAGQNDSIFNLILMPILLAIATMGYMFVLLIRQKNKLTIQIKDKETDNDVE